MGWRIFVAAVAAVVLPNSVALGQYLPAHGDVCVPPIRDGRSDPRSEKIVSKEKLAKLLLKGNDDALKLYVDASERASEPKYSPQWRRIFTDPKFCLNDENCVGPPLKPTGPDPKPDNTAALHTVHQLRTTLVTAIFAVDGRFYRLSNPNMNVDEYMLGSNEQNAIICTPTDLPAEPKEVVLKMPDKLRLRANSDDLAIDSKVDKPAFKSLKPASINFTRDGVEKTNKTSLQAALGYAVPFDIKPQGFSAFHGEWIPYISAMQSTTKVDGMGATFADTNSVAIGSLFSSRATLESMVGVAHVVSAKPQYIWNTKDKSEIASMTLVYAPWTQPASAMALPVKINTPFQIGTFGNLTWVQLLFDLRTDVGEYTKVGIDPMLAHTSFVRSGSKFGFSVSTSDNGPHVVLTVTETLLYGFKGSIRQLDYFDSSLSFYFDKTSNFAFTVSYTKGTNEDTAEREQTFKAGLSAKF